VLEREVLSPDAVPKLLHDLFADDYVASSLVLSTGNRLEVYAEVSSFHGGITAICDLLAKSSRMRQGELAPYLYVHYGDRAAQHLLAVACGLDSIVGGETQNLVQVRTALKMAREQGTLGRVLSELGALALRTGKRAHTETGIDRAGANIVRVGLAAAARLLTGDDGLPPEQALAGRSILVIGAGLMGSFAVASAAKAGATYISVICRTLSRAKRLAETAACSYAGMTELPTLLATADLVITCTGDPGNVISADLVREVLAARGDPPRPLVLLDLAMPRDVEPGIRLLPGVFLLDIENLADAEPGKAALPHEADVLAVRRIVRDELTSHLYVAHTAQVAPTVIALRAKAAQVVEAEIARLARRLDNLDAMSLEEISRALHRIAAKLLHSPAMRVKELAESPGPDSYETAVRVLFDLDQATERAVATAASNLTGWHDPQGEESLP
jgi:glutamyl-tRNA reductase